MTHSFPVLYFHTTTHEAMEGRAIHFCDYYLEQL